MLCEEGKIEYQYYYSKYIKLFFCGRNFTFRFWSGNKIKSFDYLNER